MTLAMSMPVLAQTEEEGAFDSNQNLLAPGRSPVTDPRLAPSEDAGGIVLPQESSDLPLEAAIVFGDKNKALISKDFILGFISGSILISFVAFFMLKFAKQGG